MTSDQREPDSTPALRVLFAGRPDNDYLVAELYAGDDVMVATIQWRDDVLVLSWLAAVDLWSLEVATVLSSAHQRLIDNRMTIDGRGPPPA